MPNRKDEIKEMLANPDLLLMKKPFTRGIKSLPNVQTAARRVNANEAVRARLPRYTTVEIPQEQYARELDENSHNVLFDENLPSICVKLQDGGYNEIRFERTALPIQKLIKNKRVMHLTAHKMQFTMLDTEPTQQQGIDFITFKQYWERRNQDGMKTKMVDTQLSYGDAGLLYYFDYKGEIKSRILSFKDGYILCPHNDQNGDRILETVYYCDGGVEYIDNYDDTYMYRLRSDGDGWVMDAPVPHGFSEIPLITKRGAVAWDNVQNLIESYENLYNIFIAIQRRWGWGVFYVKGQFNEKARKLAGSIVLNDTSIDGKGDAKFLTPPTPQGTIDTLQTMLENIQLGSSTTFLLPKDVKMSGDISGIAIQLTQSLDMEIAHQSVIDWQNVADKMTRLFKEGLAKELVNKGVQPTAVTDFENLNISASFKVWRPMNETEYNNMIIALTNGGVLSRKTGVELNTMSKPDEVERLRKQTEEAMARQQQFVSAAADDNNNQNGQEGGEEDGN